MILQVTADAPQIGDRLDLELPKFLGVADTGQHEKSRTVDRAGREEHFARRPNLLGAVGGHDFDPGRTVALERDLRDVAIQQQSEVRPVEVRP